MRLSRALLPTLREDPVEAKIPSHRLMLRAGLIRREAPGIYTLLPLGRRVVQKVSEIVREEMDRQGSQEVSMPLLSPVEPWKQTGRWYDYGQEMFRLKDRNGSEFCLAPTHEEVITGLARDLVSSYKQLPVLLYHIGPKFRDEIRPRFGVMRGREFLMKDLYSFDVSEEGLTESYAKMNEAYHRVFSRCGLNFRPVEADSGAIGGAGSHEFVAFSDYGESSVVICDGCNYAANIEKAEYLPRKAAKAEREEPLPMTRVATPGMHTIAAIVSYLNTPIERTAKTMFYRAWYGEEKQELVAAIIPGDKELNEYKLMGLLKATGVEKAAPEQVLAETGAPFGSAGPVGLKGARIVVDRSVRDTRNIVVGANQEGYHLVNVNPGRDFDTSESADLVLVCDGDPCPVCGQKLSLTTGIEVGQLFKLHTKYSDALHCNYTAEDGSVRPMVMGCYGIGITRTVAAIIEQHHDQDGIVWPLSVAPYHVVVTCVNTRDTVQMSLAEEVYRAFVAAGIETLLDDREERAGVKFKDADLMGIPFRVNIGRQAALRKVELVFRASKETCVLAPEEAVQQIAEQIAQQLAEQLAG